ncbi:putative membrane protein [Roseibium hamelinense]|uniref:Putative membrane protein n=1 Tax=Roseibium hamelinense TaxID=150831 RepID=A0A562TAW0_9HYPH|nr:TIGR01620 family protein [Roseibium hamelinense]MTI45274.1 TIGR01620 family protein [Roseibium hamelinense]TWI90364.1 putative membrane protein [Roseibium hamelinense]
MTDQRQTGGPKRKPTAFRLDDESVRLSDTLDAQPLASEALIQEQSDQFEEPRLPQEASTPKKAFGFGKWIAIGLGGLVSLAFGLAVDALIRDLFARTDWLGYLGLGLTAIAVIGIFGLVIREALSLARLGKIDHLRDGLKHAAEHDDTQDAHKHLKYLLMLYQDRPETARGRRDLEGHMREVIDGRDLVMLAERDLLAPLDLEARRIVMNSAKRVSIVTAVSPRALVDLLAVLFENMRIIRRLSALYGGRPGTLGFLRLAKHVATHLAVTGGMAAGDSLASQVLGHGLAARLSARLGEGVINGLLTARIGIAAIAVCRPSPFIATNGPTASDFMGELIKTAEKEERKAT